MATASVTQPTASLPGVTQSSVVPPGSSTTAPAPGGTTSRPATVSGPVGTASTSTSVSRPATSSLPLTSSSIVSTSSTPSSSTSHSTTPTPSASSPPAPNDDHHGSNNMAIIVPLASVACVLVIVYIAYKLYLLHKRRKEDPTPLPPPRTPAIFERPQSVMYSNSPPVSFVQGAGGLPPPSYRNSMRPISMIYGADQSSSSLSKASHPSTSGHSTPTNPNMTFDESGRFSPLPLPHERGSLRGPHSPNSPRPHSVASFTSGRHSVYGNGSMSRRGPAGPSYLDRVEIVLPHPLAAEQQRPMSAMASPNRYSMYNVPPSPDMRRMNMPARPVSMMVPPSVDVRNTDWTGRVTNDDAQSTSSCTAHGNRDDKPPTPPPKARPDRAQQQPALATSASGAPQLPDMFAPTSPRERSTSPPEPLLSSTAFVGSSTNGSVPNTEESIEHSASLPKRDGKDAKVKIS
ncbi:hypothetical protein CPB86DRAFT_792630 [Serendipita vermifera]|nr:hypothetical protein CPB86DRAFT_792630 [Serendipita vermifera]